LPEKYVLKINKMPEFYVILARKIIKIPDFFLIFTRKINKFPNFTRFLPENDRILHNDCPKNIFPDFFSSYAYDTCYPACSSKLF